MFCGVASTWEGLTLIGIRSLANMEKMGEEEEVPRVSCDNTNAKPKSKMTMAQRNRKRWRDRKRAKAAQQNDGVKRARLSGEGSE